MANKASLIVFLLLFSTSTFSQTTEQVSMLFYNVENLFDTKDDPQTEDDEYSPRGERYWTNQKLKQKTQNLSKVILSSSGWNLPTVVALCEVENRYVLEKLTSNTPLKSAGYKIIHKESPDHRGMDVAVLYNPTTFVPIRYKYYPLMDKNDSIMATREILYVSGVINKVDTLHFFVNHWPSRYSGLLETKSYRNNAAKLLRSKVNDLLEEYKNPKIIILGDFNDQPNDESISNILNTKALQNTIENSALYNLSYPWIKEDKGTIKYQSQWSVFDQIIVSGNLLNAKVGLSAKPENATIINHSFLLEKDEKFGGKKPKRSYYGYKYLGGFSDHLPILLYLDNNN